jgi:2-keto-4-pentenoate hydratase/2-oxohepta-3-ene-1,7-dioic acid hydratase in catechol pathway
MRIARATIDGRAEFVVGDDSGRWSVLSQLGLNYADTPALVADEQRIRAAAADIEHVLRIDDANLLNPIVRPGKILAIGLNYASHARETGATPPEKPLVFAKYTSSLNGPFAEVVIGPRVTEQADYESELAVVIGATAKGVSQAQAESHIFAYAVGNDVSSRDAQRSDGQFSRSKSADGFCPIGPWMSTADSVENPRDLRVTSTVNGEPRQTGSTADMIFSVRELISYLSTTITLEPGDVILTGTPPGVGLGFTPPRFLQPGDVVECAIDGLGAIRNTFVSDS